MTLDTKKVWAYFSAKELKCRCGECSSIGQEMHPDFMERLIKLRERMNTPFIVTSAYRCAYQNVLVSNSGMYGPHTTGKAIDIAIGGMDAYLFCREAFELAFSGIGIQQTKDKRFIHLDTLTSLEAGNKKLFRPLIWSY